MFAVWHSGSIVRRMNEVTLRRARLVLGWVTVFGRVYHLGMLPSQLGHSDLHPSGVAKLSTGFNWLEVKVGMSPLPGGR